MSINTYPFLQNSCALCGCALTAFPYGYDEQPQVDLLPSSKAAQSICTRYTFVACEKNDHLYHLFCAENYMMGLRRQSKEEFPCPECRWQQAALTSSYLFKECNVLRVVRTQNFTEREGRLYRVNVSMAESAPNNFHLFPLASTCKFPPTTEPIAQRAQSFLDDSEQLKQLCRETPSSSGKSEDELYTQIVTLLCTKRCSDASLFFLIVAGTDTSQKAFLDAVQKKATEMFSQENQWIYNLIAVALLMPIRQDHLPEDIPLSTMQTRRLEITEKLLKIPHCLKYQLTIRNSLYKLLAEAVNHPDRPKISTPLLTELRSLCRLPLKQAFLSDNRNPPTAKYVYLGGHPTDRLKTLGDLFLFNAVIEGNQDMIKTLLQECPDSAFSPDARQVIQALLQTEFFLSEDERKELQQLMGTL